MFVKLHYTYTKRHSVIKPNIYHVFSSKIKGRNYCNEFALKHLTLGPLFNPLHGSVAADYLIVSPRML